MNFMLNPCFCPIVAKVNPTRLIRMRAVLMGVVTAVSTICASLSADGAPPTPTTTYQVLSTKPANLDKRLSAQPYVIRVSPKAAACSFGVFVIAPGASAASLKSVADAALAQSKLVSVEYTVDANNFCVVSSMAIASQTTAGAGASLASVSSAANPDLGVYEGYHNAFATAHKSAFRDFGQGKFDESVDPITGKLSLTHTDVVIPGPNGLDIRVMRNYISPDPAEMVNSLAGGISFEPQINGFGWHVIANFGGIRGMVGACSMRWLTGVTGATSDFDGIYLRAETLPQWIGANGRAEPLVPVIWEEPDGSSIVTSILPATLLRWKTASGTTVQCGLNASDDYHPIATLTDGTKIEMFATTNDGYQIVGPWNAYPTKITDRWGNWLAFEYDMTYPQAFFNASNVKQGHLAGEVPITRITSSDGREVRFIYESMAPGWSPANIPQTEKILKRIEYGPYKIEYTYDRLLAGGVNILASSYAKYFLRRVDLPDGLNWSYSYGPTPANILVPNPGDALLSQLTFPNGGTASYQWGGSASFGITSNGVQLPKTYQLRNKTATASGADTGVWRYSYTDMARTAADEANDPIPTLDGRATGVGAVIPYLTGNTYVNLEAGRITGPSSIEVFHHFPRYADPTFSNFQNVPDGYGTQIPSWKLGRLLQHAIYPLGTVFSASQSSTASQITTQTYMPIYFPLVFLGNQQSVLPIVHGACSDPRCPAAGDMPGVENRGYLVRPVVTTIKRGTNSYVTDNAAYLANCGRPTTVNETGQRNRATISIFDRAGFCQATSQQINESGTRKSRTSMLLTANSFGVASETLYGTSDTSGLSKSFTYHSTGEVASATDARGYATYYDSYSRGTPQAESHPVSALNGATDPQRIAISRVVDDLGRITSETDGEGRTTRFTYNGVHKPTSVTFARAASASIAPFTYGLTTDTVTRGARTETVGYDGFGRVISFNNGISTTNYRYDAAGRRKFVSYPGSTLGQAVEFDALDRPTKLTEPDPANPAGTVATIITYNDSANTVTLKNARGYDTVLTMEAFGDPSQGWVKSRNSPEIGLMTFDRNVFGQITRVAHASTGIARDYIYDAAKGYFLSQETHPELGGVFYDRDNNGNITGKRVGSNAAPTTVYTYDGQNRLVTTTPPANGAQSAPVVNYAWYKTGQIRQAVSGGVSRDYAYDENDNLSTEQVRIDGVIRTLAYDYDALDNLSRLTYPSGKFVEFNPDVLGRPQQVGSASSSVNVVSGATYWASGMPKKITFANGVVQDFTEQTRPLVSALSIAKNSSPLISLGFGYDSVGNLTNTTDALALGYVRSASYDAFDRILGNGAETFTYEGIGDIKTKSGATFNYGAANRLLTSTTNGAGNRTYQYDAYGNATTDRPSFSYVYDALNSLRQVKVSGSTTASYDYDGHQHLAKKIGADGTTHYLYGKNGKLLGEYVFGTNKSKEYFYLGNKLVGQTAK